MKCSTCGRGITWIRLARDSALEVHREGSEMVPYCGMCVHLDKADIRPGDKLIVLLGSGRKTFRWRYVTIDALDTPTPAT